MLNRYPWWKNALVLLVLIFSVLYGLPNIYTPDPAIQISGESGGRGVDDAALGQATKALDAAGIQYFGHHVEGGRALIRVHSPEEQLKAKSAIQRALGDGFIVALNLAPTTPEWLRAMGGKPMKLGLDLSGGVHFLLEVDVDAAVQKRLDIYRDDFKRGLREQKLRGTVTLKDGVLEGHFASAELRDKALKLANEQMRDLQITTAEEGADFVVRVKFGEAKIKEIVDYAVGQNLTTLRNRVNELGVAEPLVQRQGEKFIVVQLPGVQDTSDAKRVLGKAANLEFRLEAKYDAAPGTKEEFDFRNAQFERSAWIEKDIIITGERVADARQSFDQNGQPEVGINLDSQGGQMMLRATQNNIKRRMAVLFIERKTRTTYQTDAQGREIEVRTKYDDKKIISLATIQSALGNQFRITGLDSPQEAAELALLLRAGSLAAPMDFVEERTVGPSLGAENIAKGIMSLEVGLLLVMVVMVAAYKLFGLYANLAMLFNLMLLTACLSVLGATLTLPGIAAIILTMGMAVDANVLINGRIKEEMRNGLTPHAAISAGYDRAFITIADSNITTIMTALVLLGVGSGPVRGFAIALTIGLITSMFTAVMASRVLVNLTYGGRQLNKISI